MTVEIYYLRPGPDGLTRVTARRLGEGTARSWVVKTREAEELVIDGWAEFHHGVLGFPPSWHTGE